jgi:hypothetical protein
MPHMDPTFFFFWFSCRYHTVKKQRKKTTPTKQTSCQIDRNEKFQNKDCNGHDPIHTIGLQKKAHTIVTHYLHRK